MPIKEYTIKEFKGIDQSKGGNRLEPGSSPDACNMDTEQGELMVARGYVKHTLPPVPGEETIRRMYIWRDLVTVRYIVAAGHMVYAWVTTDSNPAWRVIYTYPDTDGVEDHPPFAGIRWDFLETKIGDTNYLVIACGENQMIKWDGKTEQAALFGSGEVVMETTVASYTASTKTVVLAADITDVAKTRLKQAGIVIKDLTYPVEEVKQESKSVILKELPGTPAAGNAVKIKGGLSEAQVNFIGMHYGRLFACGDRDHPSRLYWSQPPGDERSIEDWSKDDASENASGGHVEVGNTSTDPITGMCVLSNQIIIFKRDSIYRLLGDRPNNYRVYKVYSEVEQMANSGLVIYGDTPFWMTAAGMYYHDGQNSMPMYNARQICKFLEGVNLSNCKAAENRDRLYFTCREAKSGMDDAIIVYDVPDKTYMIRRGFTVADICAVSGTLYMINDKRIIYRFDEGEDYDGKPIDAYWTTPTTDLDNKPGIKTLEEIYLRGTPAGAIIILEATIGRNKQEKRYMLPNHSNDVLEISLKNEARVFSFALRNEAGSHWSIQGGIQLLYSTRQRVM